MDQVKDLVAHVLLHINDEANGSSDPSQVPGVADRADLVRRAVAFLATDERDVSDDDFMVLLSALVPADANDASLKSNLADPARGRSQFRMVDWVGKGE